MLVRLLDLGTVPYLQSQTIFHGVAHAMNRKSPDTIIMMRPDKPYLCIGFHQELDKEVDLDFCREHNIPVLRREVGGGTVYLDGNQTFLHWIFHRDRVPRKMEELYRLYIEPIVATYQALGINAHHRPVNDILVGQRKIGGTGVVAIGDAIVVAGSLMFDFDSETMSRAVKVSSEKMRDKVFESLRDYMTTMKRELGEKPPEDKVKAILAEKTQQTLDIQLEKGELTEREEKVIARLDRRFSTSRWIQDKGGVPRKGVTISGAMKVVEADHKAPGGLIRVTARVENDVIQDLSLSGDFTFHPNDQLARLEEWLQGQTLDENTLVARIESFYDNTEVQSPGVTAQDFTKALLLTRG